MDPKTNNTQNTSPAPAQAPVQPVVIPPAQSAPPAAPVSQNSMPEKKSKMLYVLIAIVVLILVGAGVYMFAGNKGQNNSVPSQATEKKSEETQVSSEEAEVDSVTVNDPQKDFTDVDKNLQEL